MPLGNLLRKQIAPRTDKIVCATYLEAISTVDGQDCPSYLFVFSGLSGSPR
jgi:hypothetical protein